MDVESQQEAFHLGFSSHVSIPLAIQHRLHSKNPSFAKPQRPRLWLTKICIAADPDELMSCMQTTVHIC